MRKSAIILTALWLPSSAGAADGSFDVAGSVVQTLGSLALVVGLILVVYHLAGRIMKVQRGGTPFRYIRVVETRHLAPKKSLVLVEVAGEYLLLSNSGEGVNFLTRVEMLEEIEVIEENGCAALIPARLKERLQGLVQELPLALAKKSGGAA